MRFSDGVRVVSRRLFVRMSFFIGAMLVALLASAEASADTSADDDHSAGWGPEIGSQLTLLEAHDQAGTLRTLDNLAGEQGLLLFLNRSADW